MQGDAKTVIGRMLEQTNAESSSGRENWAKRAKDVVGEWYDKYKDLLESDATPMRPERICHELSKHLPDDAIVVADTGHGGMWMGGMYDLRTPSQSYMRSAGHLGWAFSAGIGAKCGAPDRPVFAFTGDAGFWYHIAEIESAARWGVNSVTLVNNNSSGNQSKRGFDRVYGGEQTDEGLRLWHFTDVNFAKIAEDMGAVGIRVEKPGELPGALDKAFNANRPVIIDVVTDIDALAPLAVV